jgi:hypothetical protein
LICVIQTSTLSENIKTIPMLNSTNEEKILHECDEIARELSAANFPDSLAFTRQTLSKLAASSAVFRQKDPSKSIQARRAERLVLGLDRLTISLPEAATNSAVNQSLNKLFTDAQSLPDFDPNQFANDLNTFHSSVAGFLENK